MMEHGTSFASHSCPIATDLDRQWQKQSAMTMGCVPSGMLPKHRCQSLVDGLELRERTDDDRREGMYDEVHAFDSLIKRAFL